MSEETENTVEAVPITPHEVTLEEFGIKLSARDNRHELVNAFLWVDRQDKNHKDTEANYQARFEAFLVQPA